MKRAFVLFATALLLALPSVSAAKDWTILTGGRLFPDSVAQGLKPGDNLDILGRHGIANLLGVKGEIRIPPGVNIYTDAKILVYPDAKLIAGEPPPAKPVNIYGPYAPETKARRGQAAPMSETNDEEAGWRIKGDARFNNINITGFWKPLDPWYGSYLKISDSRVTGNHYGIYALNGGDPPIVKRTIEVIRSTFDNTLSNSTDWPSYELLANAGYQVVFKAVSTLFGGGQVSYYSNSEETAGEFFAIFEDCEIRNPANNWTKQQQFGYVLIRATTAILGDFDNDGAVGFTDFFAFALSFGSRLGAVGWEAKFDLNKDGSVDFDDFFVFAANFGKSVNAAAKKPVALTPDERRDAQTIKMLMTK